jgi:cytoskeleton protein RodZ
MEAGEVELVELPLDGVGTTLLRAREAAGLKLSDIAERTRIAERHLILIEQGKFSAMASRAYAVGFARSYARALGLDEKAIADAVRAELAGQEPNSDRYQPSNFEPGDPARVPSARIAWIAALAALAVVMLGFMMWRNFYAPGTPIPEPEASQTLAQASARSSAKASDGADSFALVGSQVTQEPVVFTALQQGVGVKFYDSTGKQLMQKQMALGETYTVPADVSGPMIRTARPNALKISVGGRDVAKLSDHQEQISDVPVSAAALLARRGGQAAQSVRIAPAPAADTQKIRPVVRVRTAAQTIPSDRQASAVSQTSAANLTQKPRPPRPAATASAAAPSAAVPLATQSSTVSE